MTQLHKDPNAKRGTHSENLLTLLTSMNGTLEAIQRSLDMYLETKRQFFPRFYFLSNDDLLEKLETANRPKHQERIVHLRALKRRHDEPFDTAKGATHE